MKKNLILLWAFLCALLSYSQSDHSPITKFAAADIHKDDVFLDMITLPDSSVVLVSVTDIQEYHFHKYDKNLQHLEFKRSYVPGYAGPKHYRGIIRLKDRYYLYYSRMDKNDYLYAFNVLELDPVKMEFIGSTRRIIPLEAMAWGTISKIPNIHFGYRNYINTVNSYYKDIASHMASPDSSKYLFAWSRPDSASWKGNKLMRYKELAVVSDTEKVVLTVFDNGFQKLWDRELVFRNKMKVEDYAVTNDGKVYVLAKLDSAAKRKFDSNYEIFIFSDKHSQPDTLCPNLAGRSMKDGKFFSPNGKDLWITGTFSDRSFADGVYTTSIYDTLPHYEERIGDMARLNKGKGDIYLRKILKTGNGQFRMIFEEYSNTVWGSNRDFEERSGHAVINERFEDLHVMSVDSKGNIAWVADIPKLQSDIKNAGSVYTYLPFKVTSTFDGIRIYYIDNKRNFESSPSAWKTDYELGRHARMAGVYVSPSGNFRKYNIGKIDELGTLKGHYFFSGAYMYTAKDQNKKNRLYKLKID